MRICVYVCARICRCISPNERVVDCFGYMIKLNATNGALIWAQTNFKTREHGYGGHFAKLPAPIVTSSGAVYHANNDGTIYSLDAATGKINWNFDSGAAIGGVREECV